MSDLVVIDGFYRFTGAQRLSFRAVAERGLDVGNAEAEVLITVPWEARRPLLFAEPTRTLEHLRAEFACTDIVLIGPQENQTFPPMISAF